MCFLHYFYHMLVFKVNLPNTNNTIGLGITVIVTARMH